MTAAATAMELLERTRTTTAMFGWTCELKYTSAERKGLTGYSILRDGNGEYIGAIKSKHAILAANAPDLATALEEIDSLLDGSLPITHQIKQIAQQALCKARRTP